MHCREFRKQHTLFIDDLLPGVTTWAMRDHLATCPACSRVDSQLRRALLVVRNAPNLRPSAGFERRLAARLAAERAAPVIVERPARWSRASRLVAAAIAIAAGITAGGISLQESEPPIRVAMAPVVVTPPRVPAEPVAAPAVFATVSSSLPVYPAMLLAQRATAQFAATHARTLTFQASH